MKLLISTLVVNAIFAMVFCGLFWLLHWISNRNFNLSYEFLGFIFALSLLLSFTVMALQEEEAGSNNF